MGKGPNKSIASRILDGNPGGRPLPVGEPQATPSSASCPKWLNPEAKKFWKSIAPELKRLGLLTVADEGTFAILCQSYGTWKECELAVQELGRTYEKPNGTLSVRPEVRIGESARNAYRNLCGWFGLDPSSRARLAVRPWSKSSDREPMVRLLERKSG